MSDRITIPPAALEAAARAAHQKWREQASVGDDIAEYQEWDDLSPEVQEEQRENARAACLAMLESWPGMDIERFAPWSKDRTIHLPLPQEARDE